MSRSRSEAEDITSDVFIRAYEAKAQFEPHADYSFGAWIMKIARNRCIEKHRRKRHDLELDELTAASSSPDVDLTIAVQMAFERLPVRYKEALTLNAEGYDREESAEILQLTVAGYNSLLHRARRAVRDSLKDKSEVVEFCLLKR